MNIVTVYTYSLQAVIKSFVVGQWTFDYTYIQGVPKKGGIRKLGPKKILLEKSS